MSKSKIIMVRKLALVQESLMGMEFEDINLHTILPIIFHECQKQNMTFWFNFIENACVLNLRDTSHENLELNIRLYYPKDLENSVSCKELKEQVLINAFLLTNKSIVNSDTVCENTAVENYEPIPESNDVPPTAIRTVMSVLEKDGEPVTKKNIEKHLQLDKMSIDNRRRCIAYLRSMRD